MWTDLSCISAPSSGLSHKAFHNGDYSAGACVNIGEVETGYSQLSVCLACPHPTKGLGLCLQVPPFSSSPSYLFKFLLAPRVYVAGKVGRLPVHMQRYCYPHVSHQVAGVNHCRRWFHVSHFLDSAFGMNFKFNLAEPSFQPSLTLFGLACSGSPVPAPATASRQPSSCVGTAVPCAGVHIMSPRGSGKPLWFVGAPFRWPSPVGQLPPLCM